MVRFALWPRKSDLGITAASRLYLNDRLATLIAFLTTSRVADDSSFSSKASISLLTFLLFCYIFDFRHPRSC